jgi:hypothetical protein
MRAQTWINRLKKYNRIVASEFDDYDKLSEEQLEVLSFIIGDIDNNIGDWEDLRKIKNKKTL